MLTFINVFKNRRIQCYMIYISTYASPVYC